MLDKCVRILRADGTLEKGASVPSIEPEQLRQIYRTMLLNRRVDERMFTLQRQGRIGFYIGSIGEEAAVIGSACALEETDWILPCYRELGAALWRGYPLYELFCQLFGNAEDAIKGRQMPNHYALPERRFGSISSPVGTQIPQATGIAMAARLTGSRDTALVYFGDGATSAGDFHVGLNFAGVYKAPAIFFCRNNRWAISVPVEAQTASESIAVKAKAYGMEGVRVDGNDVLGVVSVTEQALERARSGDGPTLIEALTYRVTAHSTSDDPRAYRDEECVEPWRSRDPILRFRTYLIGQGQWSEEKDQALEDEIKSRIQASLLKAEAVGPPPLETMFTDVFQEMPWNLREQYEELKETRPEPVLESKI